MAISKQQIQSLISLVTSVEEDTMDCDGCFGRVAEFAERELSGKPLCEAMKMVETHLRCCPCCRDEYKALMDGLRELHSLESDENGPVAEE